MAASPGTLPPIEIAVILAGGLATRLWPVSLATPKSLLPSQSTPLVLSAVNEALEAGIHEVTIVAGPEDEALYRRLFARKAQLESHMAAKGNFRAVTLLREIAEKGARVRHVVQKEPRGPGDAVLAAAEHVGDRPFAVMMPDDHFFTGRNPGCLAQMMTAYRAGKAGNIMCAMEVPEEEIARYGMIQGRRDEDGSVFITDVTEKPVDLDTVGGSRMAVMGRDICQPGIMRILATVGPGAGGEVQLRDAQKALMREPGQTFYGYHLTARRGLRLDYGTLAGRRDGEALLGLIENPRVIAKALAAARMLAPDSELIRFADSAEGQRLFRTC